MTQDEFVNANSRMERYYDKEYTQAQRKEMYITFKDWNISKYIKAITYCIRNNNFLPKIKDLLNAEEEMHIQTEKPEIEFIKCDKCSDGFIKYYKSVPNGDSQIQYEYVALCTCENGKKQKEINGYNLPLISQIGL